MKIPEIVTLERIDYQTDGTYGEITIRGRDEFLLYTVERARGNNTPYTECIPEGVYICRKRWSDRFGFVYEVTDVDGRTHILIHVANKADQLQGCIGLGLRKGYLDGVKAVLDSRVAMEKFKDAIFDELFVLHIKQSEMKKETIDV